LQRVREFEQNREKRRIERKKRQEQAMKEALKATDEQWKLIKPRLERVKELAHFSSVSVGMFAGGAGGASGGSSYSSSTGTGGYAGGTSGGRSPGEVTSESKNEGASGSAKFVSGWSRPYERKSPSEMNEGERACEELLELLEDKRSRPEEIKEKMENLRNIRRKAKRELIKARQELCDVLTYRQEAALIMMRWLQ
jgi:hypothetical protein